MMLSQFSGAKRVHGTRLNNEAAYRIREPDRQGHKSGSPSREDVKGDPQFKLTEGGY